MFCVTETVTYKVIFLRLLCVASVLEAPRKRRFLMLLGIRNVPRLEQSLAYLVHGHQAWIINDDCPFFRKMGIGLLDSPQLLQSVHHFGLSAHSRHALHIQFNLLIFRRFNHMLPVHRFFHFVDLTMYYLLDSVSRA